MNLAGKVLVGSLAALGALVVGSVVASRFLTVAVYSPYLPQYDLLAVNGRTIWSLMARGGGDTPPKAAGGMPFPIGLRVYWFEKKPSIGAHLYETIAGKPFETGDIIGG
jgi:hypothetical protein